MKILFIVFPQRSHVNATLSLARRLANDGHEVCYAGARQLRDYVVSFGFAYHVRDRDVYGWVEEADLRRYSLNFRLLRWVFGLVRFDRYRREYLRDGDLTKTVAQIAPDWILVDRAYSLFAPILFKTGKPFGIFVSMGNLSRSIGIPPQDTAFVPGTSRTRALTSNLHWYRYYMQRSLRKFFDFRLEFDRKFLRMAESVSGRDEFRFDRARYFHIGIREVPELLLFPQEFDLPRALLPHQYHIGPFAELGRQEENYDFAFDRVFERFCADKATGRPLVFCGFGTAAWRYKRIRCFMRLLISQARISHWNLIVAGPRSAAEPDIVPLSQNIAIFERVPQQLVLQQADLMIGHGGMNSIVESILAGVPMLICPGMSNSDQPGNAARVCYHGIGEQIDLRWEGRKQIAQKIENLVTNQLYRNRVACMRAKIVNSNAHKNAEQILYEIFQKLTTSHIYNDVE